MTAARPTLGLGLERHHAAIEAGLARALEPYQVAPFTLVRYHFGWRDREGNAIAGRSGKLLRPALCLLCCEAAGGDVDSAVPAAVAIELLHNFTLIHDDVEDASAQRHGRDTVWRVWGDAQAINAGDGLFALAHLTLLGLGEVGRPAEQVIAAARLLGEATVRLCEGQQLDLQFEGAATIARDDYLRMIEGKTASLLSASCAIGALLGGATDKAVDAFAEYGRRLGLAFQVRDDLLAIWGDPAKTGKSFGDDIRAGKRSYPIVLALERASGDDERALRSMLGRPTLTDQDVAAVSRLLERHGARAGCEQFAEEQAQSAIDALRDLSLADQRADLEALARFAVERDS
jgi:geranylgeranyl diphosphate synthase type I